MFGQNRPTPDPYEDMTFQNNEKARWFYLAMQSRLDSHTCMWQYSRVTMHKNIARTKKLIKFTVLYRLRKHHLYTKLEYYAIPYCETVGRTENVLLEIRRTREILAIDIPPIHPAIFHSNYPTQGAWSLSQETRGTRRPIAVHNQTHIQTPN